MSQELDYNTLTDPEPVEPRTPGRFAKQVQEIEKRVDELFEQWNVRFDLIEQRLDFLEKRIGPMRDDLLKLHQALRDSVPAQMHGQVKTLKDQLFRHISNHPVSTGGARG